MNNSPQISGVTLLEIMLVLAVVAAIVVGSVRYYQTATAINQLNVVSTEILAIVGAAQEVAQPTGSFSSGLNNKGKAALAPYLPGNVFNTPWGTTMDVKATTATLSIMVPGVPGSICDLLSKRLALNKHFSVTAGICDKTAPSDMTYTYNVIIK